jgi:thiol-disulfide isomerase/thioredoxin
MWSKKGVRWAAQGALIIAMSVLAAEASAQTREAVLSQAWTLSGEPAAFKAQPGQLVLVKLWASWCGPCREDLLYAQDVVRSSGGRLVLLALNVDRELEVARDAARRWQLEAVVLWDRDQAALRQLRPQGLPAAALFDDSGALRWRGVGADAGAHGALRAALAALFKEYGS